MIRSLIVLAFLILIGCAAQPRLLVPDEEKIMRYDAIKRMCMEDAYLIGFAASYLGDEEWRKLIRAFKEHYPKGIPYIYAE